MAILIWVIMNDNSHEQEKCPTCGTVSGDYGAVASSDSMADLSPDTIPDKNSPTGQIIILSNGLIVETDSISAELFGNPQTTLSGKPFTLYIHRDDLVDWFVHRNALFTTQKTQSFEIKLLRNNRSDFRAKLDCTYITHGKQNTDGMRVAIRDYTNRRQTLDHLEHEYNQNQIIQRITTDMIRCPAREIDAILIRELKTLAIFADVERAYFGVIDEKNASFTLTHEWRVSETGQLRPPKRSIPLNDLPGLKRAFEEKNELLVKKVEGVSQFWNDDLKWIHMAGTQSFAYFPVQVLPLIHGAIGYDSTNEKRIWKKAFTQLYQFAGQAFLNALLRKKDEAIWLKQNQKAMESTLSVLTGPKKKTADQIEENVATEHDVPLIIEASSGDMFEIFDVTGNGEYQVNETEWQYAKAPESSEDSKAQDVRVVDDRVLITCPRCMRQDYQEPNDFKAIGKSVLATCPCRFQFELKSEMRLFYRKAVDLEGVFVRTKGLNFTSDSINYSGKARITNVSKRGIGFNTEGPNNLSAGDQVRIKFTLNNNSRSLITKHVLIKGVNDYYAGGEFVGADRHDITLGFYLM